jgi:hypothetical protein
LLTHTRAPSSHKTQNYADNRYWTMWKLPMFGCTDPTQVRARRRVFLHARGAIQRFPPFSAFGPRAARALLNRAVLAFSHSTRK